ncbi:M28 family peptidase [Planctomycetota bacterium]
MIGSRRVFNRILFCFLMLSWVPVSLQGQSEALRTPLDQETLTLLTNEISGQMVYNNMVLLAGAPWVRDRQELTDTFYESQKIYDITRSYGIETARLERYGSDRTFEYPFEAEFWITAPDKRLVARLGVDAALVARGSQTADVSGELIYIKPMTDEEIKAMAAAGRQDKYTGKIALLWSHPRGELAAALDVAGVQAVISFNSRDRYFDPDQVVYSSGSYSGLENLKIGFAVSWRQWSELMEDVEAGKKITVRCKTRIETFKDRFETVFSWIPGTEPDKKGVVFTAHLFEGFTKRGANDNMGGCVIQLEILRALDRLIKTGQIPQPRRNIYFIWPNEISGTYEFIKNNPGFPDKLSININMDMCSEGLRINNSWFTMSECPNHLPSYLDGLAASIMNYVWRTNDIVYLPDSPRGRAGGQYFPIPMWEKNGSRDAFRFYIHRATGGSDHVCFNNSSVAVPGIEFFTWPDYWYHADTDTPDKGDPTQMKRVAFIGAACAWAAANCTDEVLPGLIDVTSEFGYARIAERELVKALDMIETAAADNLNAKTNKALYLAAFAVNREKEALQSIEEIHSHSDTAIDMLKDRVDQWELYAESLRDLLLGYAEIKAEKFNLDPPSPTTLTAAQRKYAEVLPALHPDVKGKLFSFSRDSNINEYLEKNPDLTGRDLARNRTASSAVLNYINGQRSITTITHCVATESNAELTVEQVAAYIEILKAVGWVE